MYSGKLVHDHSAVNYYIDIVTVIGLIIMTVISGPRFALVVMAIFLFLNGSEKFCQAGEALFGNVKNMSCSETAAANVHQCPTWFLSTIQNGTVSCSCRPKPEFGAECDANNNQTELMVGRCMTFDSSTNMTFFGLCPFNSGLWDNPRSSNLIYTKVPQDINDLNDFMCGGLNRTGLLCSQCQDGLGPAVLSYKWECVECLDSRYGWLLYISLTLLPTTFLCIIIIILRFNATSAEWYIFIVVCQIVINVVNYFASPLLYDVEQTITAYIYLITLTFYGIWNLDFFRYLVPPFCISSKMTTMQVIALDYTVALYPLILTAVVYYFIEFHDKGYRVFVWMWRPFRRCFFGFRRTWNLKGSVVNAFATSLLLSFSKFVTVSRNLFYAINPLNVCDESLQRGYLTYYDLTMEYFGSRHLPFAIPGLFITVMLVIFPALLLLFYQNKYFQKCLGCSRLRLTLLHELARITQSCYKDGTAGTRDCRWFAGFYMICRIFSLLIIGLSNFSLLLTIELVVNSSIFAILRPYKKEVHNILAMIILNLLIIATVWMDASRYVEYIPLWPVMVAYVLPFIYFILHVAHKLMLLIGAYRGIKWAYQNLVKRFKTSETEDTLMNSVLPYRLLNSAEYPPLVPK